MRLTWDEFLELASVISNLTIPINNFNSKEIEFKEKKRRVIGAAKDYLEFFNDFKYIEFMNEVRKSLKKNKDHFQVIHNVLNRIIINEEL